MIDYTTLVRLVDGRAEVQTGNRTFGVSRRDLPNEPNACPIELVIGALGS